jgi:hypothetical protein
MNKNDIDRQAEREANALRKQSRTRIDKRIVLAKGSIYGKDKFDKLFKK